MSRRVATNAAALAALKIGGPVCSWLLILTVSRTLGAPELGRYSLAYTWLAILSLLGPLGLPTLLTREASRQPALLGPLLTTAAFLGGTLSALLGIATAAAGFLLGYDPATRRAVLILCLALVPTTLQAYGEAAFLARQQAAPLVWAAAAEHVLKVGLGCGLLYAGYGLEAVLCAAVLGRGAACLVSGWWLRRLNVPVSLRPDAGLLRLLAAEAPVFALAGVCATLYWRVDVLLLAQFQGLAAVGIYTAAYRLLDAAILLPQSFCQAVYPELASRGAREREAAPARWLWAGTLPAAALVALGAAPLVRWLYGAEFAAAAPVLAVLIWTAVPYALNRYRACVLVAGGRQRADLAINAALLAVNVALNLALIPRWGARGAALVTLATALLYGAAQRAALRVGAGGGWPGRAVRTPGALPSSL